MISLPLDIKTIIGLLVIGNLMTVVILVSFQSNSLLKRQYNQFIMGNFLLAGGWALLYLRGQIPNLLSVYFGNTLLFSGFALETSAITNVSEPNRKREQLFASITVGGLVIFWLVAHTPSLWVAFSSIYWLVSFWYW